MASWLTRQRSQLRSSEFDLAQRCVLTPSLGVIALLLFCCVPVCVHAACQGEVSEPRKTLPGDRERTEQVVVTAAPHEYRLVMKAAVDGVMTRMPIGYAAYHQGWQPNRSVLLENVGETDVVNPWLIVNGKRRWRTLAELARQAVGSYTEDRDKARAVWEFTRHHRFHACTWCGENNDAVKVFNVYGYTLCGNDAQVIADLWQAAGLKIRRGHPVGHVVTEVFYDGSFHLLDGDEHCIYLRRDNQTIAGEAEIVRDHDLIKRTHTYGILARDNSALDQFSASLFGYEGERKDGGIGGRTRHTMDAVLRPGESFEWRWDHLGKQYTAGTSPKKGKQARDGNGDLSRWGKRAYATMRNGKLRYRPDFARAVARRGIADSANLAPDGAFLGPAKPGQPSHVTWRIASPYVIVGGAVRVAFRRGAPDDLLRVSLSKDGKKWQTVWQAVGQTGSFEETIVFDDKLSLRARPQYAYLLRVEMTSGAETGSLGIERIAFDTDVQMAALALPELEAGQNTIRYEDETPGERQVRITHAWVERTAWHPPPAPQPATPADGATVQGTRVQFAWTAPKDPDGDSIEDYQIQVSAHSDMRWVLSPNFDKVISHTASHGKTVWTVPYVGLLNPDTSYAWRVRAKDAKGVWGVWSQVRSFRCDVPGVPLDVAAVTDARRGTVTLTWAPNPQGAAAVAYRVYASDEKGFSVSDVEHKVRMGRGFCSTLEEYEARKGATDMVATLANFVLETAECRAQVVGPELDVPNANQCFYRVVAVDARGLRSGASDYAETPRPFLHTRPPSRVTVGQAFLYEPRSLLSIGDLRCKRGYKAAFWNREKHVFALAVAPDWLSIDASTGRVQGTPGLTAVGAHNVTVRVTDDRGRSAEQVFKITVRTR